MYKRQHLEFLLNHAIAVLKIEIEENEEGLELIKSCWKYVVKNGFEETYPEGYYTVLHDLANAYRKLNFLDSARVYTRIGLVNEQIRSDGINYNRFLLLNGILESYLDRYDESKKQLTKAVSKFEDTRDYNLLFAGYYFLGKTNLLSGNKVEGLEYLSLIHI